MYVKHEHGMMIQLYLKKSVRTLNFLVFWNLRIKPDMCISWPQHEPQWA